MGIILNWLIGKRSTLENARRALESAQQMITAQEKTINQLRTYSEEMLDLCRRQGDRILELEQKRGNQ